MATNVTKKGKLKNIDVENNTETLMHPETSSDVVLIENVNNSAIPSNVDNLTELVNEMGSAAYASTNDFSPPIVVTPTSPFPTTKQLEIGKITVGNTTNTLYSPGVFTPPWKNDAGSMGLVPGPESDQGNNFLRGDGTWKSIIESGSFNPEAWHSFNNDAPYNSIMDTYRKEDGTTYTTKARYWRTGNLVYIRMYIVFDARSIDTVTYDIGTQITGLPFTADQSVGRIFMQAYTASHLVGGFNLQAYIDVSNNSICLRSSKVGNGDYNDKNYLYRLDATGDDQNNTVPTFKVAHPTVHISGVFPIKDA